MRSLRQSDSNRLKINRPFNQHEANQYHQYLTATCRVYIYKAPGRDIFIQQCDRPNAFSDIDG